MEFAGKLLAETGINRPVMTIAKKVTVHTRKKLSKKIN